MSSNIPTIDSEEYRIEKKNRIARTLALRRDTRDRVEMKYYNEFCDKLNNVSENKDRFKLSTVELLVNLVENLRDNVDEKNELNDLIHYQCLQTVTIVAKNVEKLGAEIASLKQRQKEEYYDMRRYLLLIFMIVIPLFPFFKK